MLILPTVRTPDQKKDCRYIQYRQSIGETQNRQIWGSRSYQKLSDQASFAEKAKDLILKSSHKFPTNLPGYEKASLSAS
jgi:hypothetical protein